MFPASLQVAETDVDWKLRTIFAPAVQLQPCTHGPYIGVSEVGGANLRMPAPNAPRHQQFHSFVPTTLRRV